LTRQFDYGLGLGSNFSSAFNATHYDNIANSLWQSDTVAIIDFEGFKEKTTAPKYITHSAIFNFVSTFDLSPYSVPFGAKGKLCGFVFFIKNASEMLVCVALPEGLLHAVCILSVMTRWCAVPLPCGSSKTELEHFMKCCNADAIIFLGIIPY